MSIESMTVVLHHAPYTGRDKLVLLGIANHDGDGGAWPSKATLAAYANCSESSLKRSLDLLIKDKAIVKHVQEGGTARMPEWARPNLYTLNVCCPPNCDKTKKHQPVDKDLPNHWLPGFNTEPPSNSEPRGGSTDEPRGGSTVGTLTVIEPPMNKTGLPLSSTSPEEPKTCWACGQPKAYGGSYCTDCSNTGRNTPMINCKGCSRVTRRTHPGQQYFYCTEHKALKP